MLPQVSQLYRGMYHPMPRLLSLLQVLMLLPKSTAFPAASVQLRDFTKVGELLKIAKSRTEYCEPNFIKDNLD